MKLQMQVCQVYDLYCICPKVTKEQLQQFLGLFYSSSVLLTTKIIPESK